MNTDTLPAIGTTGTYSGFPATVARHYHGMLELRVPGGLTCVDASSFIPDEDSDPRYDVAFVELWRNPTGEYVVALRDHGAITICDDTGKPERAEHPTKGIALREANRLSKHYGVRVVVDKSAGGAR